MSYLLDKGMVLLEKKYKQIKQSRVYNKESSASETEEAKMSSPNVCLDTDIASPGDLQVPPCAAHPHLLRRERQKSESAAAKLQIPESTFKTKCSSWSMQPSK